MDVSTSLFSTRRNSPFSGAYAGLSINGQRANGFGRGISFHSSQNIQSTGGVDEAVVVDLAKKTNKAEELERIKEAQADGVEGELDKRLDAIDQVYEKMQGLIKKADEHGISIEQRFAIAKELMALTAEYIRLTAPQKEDAEGTALYGAVESGFTQSDSIDALAESSQETNYLRYTLSRSLVSKREIVGDGFIGLMRDGSDKGEAFRNEFRSIFQDIAETRFYVGDQEAPAGEGFNLIHIDIGSQEGRDAAMNMLKGRRERLHRAQDILDSYRQTGKRISLNIEVAPDATTLDKGKLSEIMQLSKDLATSLEADGIFDIHRLDKQVVQDMLYGE